MIHVNMFAWFLPRSACRQLNPSILVTRRIASPFAHWQYVSGVVATLVHLPQNLSDCDRSPFKRSLCFPPFQYLLVCKYREAPGGTARAPRFWGFCLYYFLGQCPSLLCALSTILLGSQGLIQSLRCSPLLIALWCMSLRTLPGVVCICTEGDGFWKTFLWVQLPALFVLGYSFPPPRNQDLHYL